MAKDALKADIVRLAYWKQVWADRSVTGKHLWHLPKVAASIDQVNAAQTELDFEFSGDYKQFLCLANGWKAFNIEVDLFGTHELLAKSRQVLAERDDVKRFLNREEVGESEALVIGASDFAVDVFLLVSMRNNSVPGAVIWFASEEVERYPAFSDFLSAMVNYQAVTAEKHID